MMAEFVDREQEVAQLNQLLGRDSGQFALIYGRRRVGKTTLLRHWATTSEQRFVYWVARREPAASVRYSLARAFWRGIGRRTVPRFDSWEDLFEEMAHLIGDDPMTLIFDEFSYAVESDSSITSHLQAAWDHLLKEKRLTLVVAGSHIGMMTALAQYQAPLYGRFTSQLQIEPLPFGALAQFFPTYTAEQRVAIYAVLGGIAGYLEQLDPTLTVGQNIKEIIFRPMSLFQNEPTVLISDLVREPRMYQQIIRAIADGSRTVTDIASSCGVVPSNISPYLQNLRDLTLIERRIPATVPPNKRRDTRRSRYYLRDPYLRFYYRFIDPNLELLELGASTLLWERISEQFRAFIGATAWEEICTTWTREMARRDLLPFPAELVGSHWSSTAQIDIVAINWREKQILLGECKWGTKAVGRAIVQDLIAKTPLVRPDDDWTTHYALFARAGFTAAAIEEAKEVNALLIDLPRIDTDLQQWIVPSY